MGLVYVERKQGAITIVNRLPGPGREAIDENDPELDPILRKPAPAPADRANERLAADELVKALIAELAEVAGVTEEVMLGRVVARLPATPVVRGRP